MTFHDEVDLFCPSAWAKSYFLSFLRAFPRFPLPALSHPHIACNIKKGGKGQSKTQNLRLGRPLTIATGADAEEEFEDLDEVLARFIEPLSNNIRRVLGHRKFAGLHRVGTWSEGGRAFGPVDRV